MASTEPRLHSALAPEHRVLFASASTHPWYPRDGLSEAQWQSLRYTVEREKAAIAVWRMVSKLSAEAMAGEAAALRGLALVMEFRMHHLQQRLVASVAALREARIPCLLLKGAAIATVYHGSFAERPMLDLDLLVPPDKAVRARSVLLNAGWSEPPAEAAVKLAAGGIHHLPALHDASGVEVNLEVHQDLFPPGHPFTMTTADMWGGARALSGDLEGAFVPSPVHLAVHACIHLAWSHMLRTGTWRACGDLRAITADQDFDWESFVALAIRCRAATALLLDPPAGVGACRDAGAPRRTGPVGPAGRFPGCRPLMNKRLDAVLERHLLAVLIPGGPDCPSVRIRRIGWSLALRPDLSGHGAARPWRIGDGDDPSADQAERLPPTMLC